MGTLAGNEGPPWHLPKPVYERNLPQPLWAPHERVFQSSTGGAPVHALGSFKFCSRWVHVGQVLRVEGTMSGIVGDGGTFGAALKPMVWRFSIESSWAAPFGRTKPVVSQVVGGQTDSSPPLNEAHCAADQTFPRALCQKPHLSGTGFGELDPSADEDSTDGGSNHECDGKQNH